VLLDLKAILTLLCLKRLVIFLIRGEVYVKVAHLVVTSLSACEAGWIVLCCFNVSINCSGMLLFRAVSNMVSSSLSCQSEVSGSVSILSM